MHDNELTVTTKNAYIALTCVNLRSTRESISFLCVISLRYKMVCWCFEFCVGKCVTKHSGMHVVILFGTELHNEIKRSRFKAPIWMSFFTSSIKKAPFEYGKSPLLVAKYYDLKIRGHINLHLHFFFLAIYREVCNIVSHIYYRIVAKKGKSCLVTRLV